MTATPAISIERVLDEEHTVLVTIRADRVVEDVVRALEGLHGSVVLIQQLPAEHPARVESIRKVVAALDATAALQVPLTGPEGLNLSQRLFDASLPVAHCWRLGCLRLTAGRLCDECEGWFERREAERARQQVTT